MVVCIREVGRFCRWGLFGFLLRVCRSTWANDEHVYKTNEQGCAHQDLAFFQLPPLLVSWAWVFLRYPQCHSAQDSCVQGVDLCPVVRAVHPPCLRPRVQVRLDVRNQATFISFTHPYPPDFLGSVGASPAESFVSGVVSAMIRVAFDGPGGGFVRDTDRLLDVPGVIRPSGMCNFVATVRAFSCCPFVNPLTTSGRMSAHICNALIEPHSMILLFSHCSDTGFVRKSLQPAASAATRSVCNDEAVRATMMTEERKGVEGCRDSDVESDGVF